MATMVLQCRANEVIGRLARRAVDTATGVGRKNYKSLFAGASVDQAGKGDLFRLCLFLIFRNTLGG